MKGRLEGTRTSFSLVVSNDEALVHLMPMLYRFPRQSHHYRKGGGSSFSATGLTGPLFSTPLRLVVLILRLSVRATGDLERCPVLQISIPRFDKV